MDSVVKRRRFGKTGLYVSELSFGAMNLRKLASHEEAYKILNFVIDRGINLIDTARAYNGTSPDGLLFESEVLVGNTIRNRDDLDEPIVIVTKGHGYTLPELEIDLQTSLSKLGIQGKGQLKIGPNEVKLVYFFHGINEKRWSVMLESGVLDEVKKLKEQGVINYIGFSSHYGDGKAIKEAADTGIFDVVELPYNVYNRSVGEDGEINLLEYLYNKDIGIINMKAFGGNSMPALYNVLREYVSIDYETMLNFCLSNPYITTVDAGARYVEEFEADIATSLKERFTKQQLDSIKAEADKIAKHMNSICRECMHCLEKFKCTRDIDFPGVLSLYSRYIISEKLGRETDSFKKKYKEFELNGGDCIGCGECMPWCEYKLNIPEMMKKAHEILSAK